MPLLENGPQGYKDSNRAHCQASPPRACHPGFSGLASLFPFARDKACSPIFEVLSLFETNIHKTVEVNLTFFLSSPINTNILCCHLFGEEYLKHLTDVRYSNLMSKEHVFLTTTESKKDKTKKPQKSILLQR